MLLSNRIARLAYYLLCTDLCLTLGVLLPIFMYFVAQLPEVLLT